MSFRGGSRGGGRGGSGGGFRGGRGGFQQRDMGPPAQVLGMPNYVLFLGLILLRSCSLLRQIFCLLLPVLAL